MSSGSYLCVGGGVAHTRRDYRGRSAQPGFLHSGGRRGGAPAPRTWFQRFWSEEIMHPSKFWGNVSVAWGVAFFAMGIVFARKAGFLLAPVF